MTNEQLKMIDRCKLMLKTALPEYSGKLIFTFNKHRLGASSVECTAVEYDLKALKESID